MKIIKALKIRLLPTSEQEEKLWKHINASRFIYNYMLELQIKRYQNNEKHLSGYDMNRMLTIIKNDGEHDWLYEVSNATLQRSCSDLAQAYTRFFKKTTRFPRFKSKKAGNKTFPLSDGIGKVWFNGLTVNIQKVGKVKYQTNLDVPLGNLQKFINPRIIYTSNKKWMLILSIECENQAFKLTNNKMGIDLGVKELAVISYNNNCLVFHNKNKSKKVKALRNRLKHLQRNLQRKYITNKSYKETNNIRKMKEKIAKQYYHLSNIQLDYIHKITHQLIQLKPNRVVMEDLKITQMMRNKSLAKAIQEQSFYKFRQIMKYKCDWNEIEFVIANQYYPSSKRCSQCGSIKKDLKLKDRIYECPNCGSIIDRDYNAAINLMEYEI